MKEDLDASIPRRSATLRPEYVPLGFLVEKPTHGYELYRRFSDTLSGLWRISESQMYATLKRLEERGILEGLPPTKGAAASRRMLVPTQAGRASFEEWLSTPTACNPRALRLEFLTRIFFARRIAPTRLAALCEGQRAAVERAIERTPSGSLHSLRDLDVQELARSFREIQLRSALRWLDESVSVSIGSKT